MKQSLQYASFLLFLFIQSSCSPKLAGEATALPPLIETGSQSQKYNMQLNLMKHHFSGMLIIRQMSDNEIRILGSTYFGLSLFDFSLYPEEFKVNSCLEPLRKQKILMLLENDFNNLFLPSSGMTVKKKSTALEKRISGKGFGKSVFYLSDFDNGQAGQIRIKHPWIRLTIQLDELNENSF